MMLHTHRTHLHRVVTDAVTRRDPTGTADIRSRFNADLVRRWAAFRNMTRQALIDGDILGLGNDAQAVLVSTRDPVLQFQQFVDAMLKRAVLGEDGEWLRPYLQEAAQRGRSRAAGSVGFRGVPPRSQTAQVVASGAIVELQGVMEAVSQQAVRAASNGIVIGSRARDVAKVVAQVVARVGIIRSRALVSFAVVRAFNLATLEAFEELGVRQVAIDPEFVRRPPPVLDAPARGPGSRTSREGPPSARTVRRIRKAQRKVEELQQVEVITAGDDLVCEECEDISQGGPYDTSEARSLIPAHPNCRCAFVPVDDRRFAEIERE